MERDWKREPPDNIYEAAAMCFTPKAVAIAVTAVCGPSAIIILIGVILKSVFGVECIGVCGY